MGILVSELVTAEAAREEVRQTLEGNKDAIRDGWEEESGLETVA